MNTEEYKKFSNEYYGEYLDLNYQFDVLIKQYRFFIYKVKNMEEKKEFENILSLIRDAKYKFNEIEFELTNEDI